MRAAFLGTPAAAIPSLAALATVATIDVVITRPDKPQHRSARPVAPPVKDAAAEWGFRVDQPPSAAGIGALVADVDVAVVVAYGRIIPEAVLESVPFGFVNVHFSLLPRWRGAAPVQHALLAGDTTTGVSLMQLDAGLDTGPVLGSLEVHIGEDERAGELTARLAGHGAELLATVLPAYVGGRVAPEPQPREGATRAPAVTTGDARITADHTAAAVVRAVRAFHPKPGAWAVIDGERFKIHDAILAPAGPPPGTIDTVGDAVVLGAPDGHVELLTVQPQGKAPMPAEAWMNGRRGAVATLDP